MTHHQFADGLKVAVPRLRFHDNHYKPVMHQALLNTDRSPDPSTKNAAVLAREGDNLEVLHSTWAVNEFPRGVHYSDQRWEYPTKYDHISHAEESSLLAAARQGIATDGLAMICPWAACAPCGRLIIQAGIRRLVTLRPQMDPHGTWGASIKIAMTMFEEAGVQVVFLDGSFGVTVRRNGEDIEF